MTLEDFFTLTEMKDGLTAPSRVEELVTKMQKEKDFAVKNVGDASRQWVAVASTIAATENKDCLDLFIQLDGLWFLDRWLRDALKFGSDTNESFVEESITALLRAIEKLQINNERSVSSGIWITVKNLLGHKSSRVQDRAKVLFEAWERERDGDAVMHDVEDVALLPNDCSSKVVEEDAELSVQTSEAIDKEEIQPSKPDSDHILPHLLDKHERVDDAQNSTNNNQPRLQKVLDSIENKENSPDHPLLSSMSTSIQENSSFKEETPSLPPARSISFGTCTSSVSNNGTDGQPDLPNVEELSKDEIQADKVDNSSEKLVVTEHNFASCQLEPDGVTSRCDVSRSQEFVKEPSLQNNADANESSICQITSSISGMVTPPSNSKSRIGDVRVQNDGGNCSNIMQYSSGNDSMSEKLEELDTSKMDGLVVDEDRDHDSDEDEDEDEDEDSGDTHEFSKTAMDSKTSVVINKGRSDIELDYGIVDALEVARQVAHEIEREVGSEREPFCSSSFEKIDGELDQPCSPDSIKGEQDISTKVQPNDVPTFCSAEISGKGHMDNSVDAHTVPENCNHDMESSQLTEAAQELDVNTDKGLCGFDLNQDVCSDEIGILVNPVSTPISVVSVSRPAAAPGLPVAPLQFEGALGWKGSAATSAFRPASPRRVADGDKSNSVWGIGDSSKQRQDCLDFDLNVAESGDDKGKQILALSGLSYGESTVGVTPKKSERLKLDLNRMDDDSDIILLDPRTEGLLLSNQNCIHSTSPASSSSSMQPSIRNIDLNDRPYLYESLEQVPSDNINAYGGQKADASVISLLGAKVEVNRKNIVPHCFSLPNGKTIESVVDASAARTSSFLGLGPSVSYTQAAVLGYNGLATGPGMSFSSTMYGPGGTIPYMMDSRGAPVVPQIMASASSLPPSYSQPAFIMNMTTQPGLNGAGPSRPNFDLNSSFMAEGGNKDLGLRQFFISGHERSMDEHLRASSQPPVGSVLGAKRKEPDGGWEPYSIGYKHQQQPWR